MNQHNRRSVLRNTALAATGAAVAATGMAGHAAASGSGGSARNRAAPTFVFVHTTYASSATWTPLMAELGVRGHRCVAVDLPGHGPDAFFPVSYQAQRLDELKTEESPLAKFTLDDYSRRVEDVVRRAHAHGPVILVGHADAGEIICRAGNRVHDKLAHIVYAGAMCCVEFATAGEYMGTPENQDALVVPLVETAPELGIARANWRSGDPKTLREFKTALADDHTDAQFRAALNLMQPDETVRVWDGDAQVDGKTWGRIPRTYIRFSKDRTMPVALQDRMINEADRLTPDNTFAVHTVPAPHVGPLHRPEIVDILHDLG